MTPRMWIFSMKLRMAIWESWSVAVTAKAGATLAEVASVAKLLGLADEAGLASENCRALLLLHRVSQGWANYFLLVQTALPPAERLAVALTLEAGLEHSAPFPTAA